MLHDKYKKARCDWGSYQGPWLGSKDEGTWFGRVARALLPLPISFAQEIANRRVGAGQRFFIRQEDDTEVLRSGTLAEAGAVDHHHMLLTDEFGDEDVVTLRDVEGGIRVERAARRHATNARGVAAPLHR